MPTRPVPGHAHAHGQPQGQAPPPRPDFIPEVRHTVAVSSGKGGVGKSTVAVNLALALRQSGATVGIIDSDVYGPDVPMMLGTKGKPGMFDNRIMPVEAHGIKVMSIGLLVSDKEPLVWRGPMIHSFIQQMLKDVMWGALDYLVFDMPPGTGDAQLSLSQVLPLSGVVMVTTPQDVALLDVRKAIGMFQRLNVPILGVVENMSTFACPHCGQHTSIFGDAGGQRVADEYGAPAAGPTAARSRDARGRRRGHADHRAQARLGPGGGVPEPGRRRHQAHRRAGRAGLAAEDQLTRRAWRHRSSSSRSSRYPTSRSSPTR